MIDYAKGRDQLSESDKSWLIQNGVSIDIVDALDSRSVATSGVFVDPDYAKSQMKQTRELFQNTGSTEAMRVIQSFSTQTLTPLILLIGSAATTWAMNSLKKWLLTIKLLSIPT
ncbi:hypothetical protein O209_14195 [Lactiplantibacillus plantarum WHE 92]|nr:hypothetical protein O209_14195 [Lactiplantibacillus plantarum WHE 92]